MRIELSILLCGLACMSMLVPTTLAASSNSADEDEKWAIYKTKYNKTYNDSHEDAMRRANWLKTTREVMKFNFEDHSYTQAVNDFADWTGEERACFLSRHHPRCLRYRPKGDSEHQRTRSPDRPDDESRVQIDAFDKNICGRAEFVPWQEHESAFGCNSSNNSSKSIGLDEIITGTTGTNARFPFYAQVDVYHLEYHMDQCSGVIVHKDLVLTTTTCLRRISDVVSFVNVTVKIGAAKGRREREYVVEKICRPDIIETRGMNIALLKMKKPIDYAKERVAPACLRPSLSPSSTAYCSLAFEEGLFSLRARRSCKSSTNPKDTCYKLIDEGLETYNKFTDVGGPVVCYDKCGGHNSTRAFVVGVINKEPSYEGRRDEEKFAIVSDLHMQREAIGKLVQEAYLVQEANLMQEAYLEQDKYNAPYKCATLRAN